MKTSIFQASLAALLIAGLFWACQKEKDPPTDQIDLPAWEVNQPRTLVYDVEARSYAEGVLASQRTSVLTITFLGGGLVKTHFSDEPEEFLFNMDAAGGLTPSGPDPNYSPILEALRLFPPQGLSNTKAGSEWEVYTPSEQAVLNSPDDVIVQTRRRFRILEGDNASIRIQHDGYVRIVDNEASKEAFLEIFGTPQGHLARMAWTKWRYAQTGETEYSPAHQCVTKADYTGVILPVENMDAQSILLCPFREFLSLRIRY